MANDQSTDQQQDDYDQVTINRTLAIFLVSVAGLFLEMMLIRWIGTEIRIFAYLQNTILVVCFLGLGMGCFTCRSPVRMRHLVIPLAVLTLLMAVPYSRNAFAGISELLSVLDDYLIWSHAVTQSPLQSWLESISTTKSTIYKAMTEPQPRGL